MESYKASLFLLTALSEYEARGQKSSKEEKSVLYSRKYEPPLTTSRDDIRNQMENPMKVSETTASNFVDTARVYSTSEEDLELEDIPLHGILQLNLNSGGIGHASQRDRTMFQPESANPDINNTVDSTQTIYRQLILPSHHSSLMLGDMTLSLLPQQLVYGAAAEIVNEIVLDKYDRKASDNDSVTAQFSSDEGTWSDDYINSRRRQEDIIRQLT